MNRLSLGYLGPAGSFCHQAALQWIENGHDDQVLVPCDTIEEVVSSVAEGRIRRGVIPLENSLEGSVPLSLDLLVAGKYQVQGEIVIPVHHHLVGTASDLSEIGTLYSHPHALAQCRRFLREFWPQGAVEIANSTAQAAKIASVEGPKAAAIASVLAADLYGLRVLRRSIEDCPENETRFIVLGYGGLPPSGDDKTSLLVAAAEDRAGALYELLEPFALASINLTRIESRPAKQRLGQYVFFIDCQGHRETEPLATVLGVLKGRAGFLRVLGSYPRARRDRG